MLQDYIKNRLDGIPEYAEVRAHINNNIGVSIVAGNIVANARSSGGGICARVYKNGVWGLASSGDYDEDSVDRVIKAARENASFLDVRVNKNKPPVFPPVPLSFAQSVTEDKTDQKAVLDYAKAVDAYIVDKYGDLASRSVIIPCDTMEKLLYVSGGVVSRTFHPRSCIYVSLSKEAPDGSVLEVFDAVECGFGYFADRFGDPSDVFGKIDVLYEELVRKCEGIFPEAGVCDCIIDSAISGMIAHEAVGHTVEADLVSAGSVAKGALGKKVASDCITIIDYAHTAFGETVPLPVYVDDEGVSAKDAVLIKDGVLTGYMHNRESAVTYGTEPCGNARAYSFADEPLIRMRNTAISPGTDKLEDMIASIDKGYYLTKTQNGQADTTGEFMFGITMGYEIVGGKLGRAIRDTTISGVAFDVLSTVDMLSDTVSWTSSGYCGKKQPMPVSDGGPAVKCRMNIGGR